MKYAHRDLKSANILVNNALFAYLFIFYKLDQFYHVKVSDFGISKDLTKNNIYTKNVYGTEAWSAPEYLTSNRTEERSEKGDVFAFGVILWELLTRSIPWHGVSGSAIKKRVKRGEKLQVPDTCDSFFTSVIEKCWNNGKYA